MEYLYRYVYLIRYRICMLRRLLHACSLSAHYMQSARLCMGTRRRVYHSPGFVRSCAPCMRRAGEVDAVKPCRSARSANSNDVGLIETRREHLARLGQNCRLWRCSIDLFGTSVLIQRCITVTDGFRKDNTVALKQLDKAHKVTVSHTDMSFLILMTKLTFDLTGGKWKTHQV
jgi:hypothetical protein